VSQVLVVSVPVAGTACTEVWADITDAGEVQTLRIVGDLCLDVRDRVRTALDSLTFGPHLRLDAAGVNFMDSTGLAILLNLRGDRTVCLVGQSPVVARLLDLVDPYHQFFAADDLNEPVSTTIEAAPASA